MGLKDIASIQSIYFMPRDNFVGEVLIPCIKIAKSFNCMLGFFSSASLREIAPGLAEFLYNQENKMHLLISPIVSVDDQKALQEGITTHPEILKKKLIELFDEAFISESALVRHTLDCLSYLIALGRIEIKIALISNALFHPKIWMLSDGDNTLIAHGSVNMTQRALRANYEHITVELSWADSSQLEKVERFVNEFKTHWLSERSDTVVIDLPEAIRKKLLIEYQPDSQPSPTDFFKAWRKDFENNFIIPIPEDLSFEMKSSKFHIPSWLMYREGDFAHQGKAIETWEAANRCGILEMATGSGKTYTSLISAKRLYDEVNKLLVVIAVPYLPLISQWSEIVKEFGINPTVPGNESSKSAKFSTIQKCIRNLNLDITRIEILVITHNLLCESDFIELIKKYKNSALIIADEVHNLGTKRFLTQPPDIFQFKLGLSATPIRQYDDIGTQKLKEYFGDIVFRFALDEAIGKCLVPYYYYVHPVNLTVNEFEEWIVLTDKLRALGWKINKDTESLGTELPPDIQRILNRRRRILEQAELKIDTFSNIIKRLDLRNLKHTLVYASDKGRDQLNNINRILMENLKLRIHQITQEETSNPKLMRELLIKFAEGKTIQVLTAMRVLDEGVDIPEVSQAYILASTTVERQWIQRRGRILRKSKATSKKHAYLHDFFVLPPVNSEQENVQKDFLSILKSEINRIMNFAKLSLNAGEPNGAIATIRPIIEQYF